MQEESLTNFNYPFTDADEQKKALTLLLVGDIHLDNKKLEKFKKFYSEKLNRSINYLISQGDFDNINNNDSKSSTDSDQLENVSNILSFLEFTKVPLLYVPGNHDAPKLYQEKVHLTKKSVLIQKDAYQLADGLQIIGLGGSVPGYHHHDGQEVKEWEGYPYSNDSDYTNDVKNLLNKFCTDHQVQTLLLTHSGPYFSSTSNDMIEDPHDPIYGGSKGLEQILVDGKYNILANIHGHAHSGAGRSNVRNVNVINPGSLSRGDFGVMELRKDNSDKWMIQSMEFININAF